MGPSHYYGARVLQCARVTHGAVSIEGPMGLTYIHLQDEQPMGDTLIVQPMGYSRVFGSVYHPWGIHICHTHGVFKCHV